MRGARAAGHVGMQGPLVQPAAAPAEPHLEDVPTWARGHEDAERRIHRCREGGPTVDQKPDSLTKEKIVKPPRAEQERLMREALEQLQRAGQGTAPEFTYAYACGWAMSCLQRALGLSNEH